jgi:hypothetical protein
MKYLIELIDLTGFVSFFYTAIIGIAAQLGIADINPAMYITASGGFIWIIVKSIMMFKKHELDVKRECSELKKKEQEWQLAELALNEKRAEIRKGEINRLTRNTSVYLDEEIYQEMYKIESELIKRKQELLDKQKELDKLKKKAK